MSAVDRYARYRAPSESGQKLAVPPWDEMGELVAANRRWRAAADLELSGRPLAELADEGRRELIDEARRYVASYAGDAAVADSASTFDATTQPLILTGHQPGFVHPGVWLKNFAAGVLADSLGGAAVHVVIDGDACRTPAILTPAGTVESPRLAPVEFDRAAPPVAWEERRILDAALWRSFPERVRESSANLAPHPMLDEWWPAALARGEATERLGASLSQARHLTEIAWGRSNLELPQSRLCQTAAFRWFAAHLLKNLPAFATAYNDALAAYRREHRLRNHAHPVPNLAADGPWLEAPLWLWTADDPRRRPVFVRPHADGVTVADRTGFERTLPTGPAAAGARSSARGGGLDDAAHELARWEADGVKLRSRALVTTMFARLVLADLFIHGIGGAKYDEATDAICQRFFGVQPPGFATLSGTLWLPIDHPPGDAAAVRGWRHELRELAFHPEIFINSALADGTPRKATDAPADLTAAIADKRRWTATPQTPHNAAERHRAIAAANARLQALVADRRRRAEAELAAAMGRARANRILQSREFAFCLYPEKLLEQFLLDFAGQVL